MIPDRIDRIATILSWALVLFSIAYFGGHLLADALTGAS